ncbi:ATPase, partial [Xanthomonas oryzae pv. oryzicola]|nr:ATPase [Xanthomonas oryzae pv. oryzicola]
MQTHPPPKRVLMSTATLHRVIRASPERIYRAFL